MPAHLIFITIKWVNYRNINCAPIIYKAEGRFVTPDLRFPFFLNLSWQFKYMIFPTDSH